MLAEHKAIPFAAVLARAHELEAPNTSVTGPAIECLTASMRPEARLILLCARRHTDAETAEQIKAILRLELDWGYIVDQAHQHCVTPLVYQTLGTVCRLGVPKDVFARLQSLVEDNARFNLYRTAELIRLLRVLSDAGISSVPFKGPVLSVLAYGNLALREYGDLDLLVHPRDVPRTRDLLAQNGFNLVSLLKRTQTNSRFRARNKDLIFENLNGRVRLELHWRLTGRHFSFPLELKELWGRLEPVSLAGVEMPTLGTEDLFLYLCMHGSRHGWDRLVWICDIAELIRVRQDICWKRVMERASELGCERMLVLGLQLAKELLGAELPKQAEQRILANVEVWPLTRELADSLFGTSEASRDLAYWNALHLKLRERTRDRLRLHVYYFLRHLRLAVQSNERDHAVLELPSELSFLYLLLRPFRLLTVGLLRTKSLSWGRSRARHRLPRVD